MLVGVSGLSYEDASNVCGCKVGTIKSRVSRARQDLKEKVQAVKQHAVAADTTEQNE
jgi:DNA-directed RNA polymerase specialized sigma24 family protein